MRKWVLLFVVVLAVGKFMYLSTADCLNVFVTILEMYIMTQALLIIINKVLSVVLKPFKLLLDTNNTDVVDAIADDFAWTKK